MACLKKLKIMVLKFNIFRKEWGQTENRQKIQVHGKNEVAENEEVIVV